MTPYLKEEIVDKGPTGTIHTGIAFTREESKAERRIKQKWRRYGRR
jgi:hypothetical protein